MSRKVTYDQEKVKELRMKVIIDSLYVLNEGDIKKWSEYRKALMLRYAPNILPRLNAGRDDGERLHPQPLLGGLTNDTSNHSNEETPQAQEED